MPIIKLNQISFYYELHGPQDAPVLVLNNGIIMNAATSWAYQRQDLSQRYRLLLYDCRGQGQSDHPQSSYSMELHAADLAAMFEALEIESGHIAGISYGGEIAQSFALDYPQKTSSLILADTVSEVNSPLRMTIEYWIDALRSNDPLSFYHATIPWNFSPEFIESHPEIMAEARKRYEGLDFPAVIRLCESFLNVNFTSRLREIHSPTCIIVGKLDHLKGVNYARILKQGIPHAELHIIDGAGHASCWERPAEFNSILLGFLDKQFVS
jgi:3-oxoadipate enol-lactonase